MKAKNFIIGILILLASISIVSALNTVQVGFVSTSLNTSNMVPYNGAIMNVDLGVYTLTSAKVGVGTTSPNSLLEVTGSSPKIEIDSITGQPELQFSDGGTDEFAIGYDTGSNFFYFNEGGIGNKMVIKDGGNVGIGTTSPSHLLHVNGQARIDTLCLNANCSAYIYYNATEDTIDFSKNVRIAP